VWSSARILWDQQILLLWILLPPVFLFCGFLVFAAPLLFGDRSTLEADNDTADQPEIVTERVNRRAA